MRTSACAEHVTIRFLGMLEDQPTSTAVYPSRPTRSAFEIPEAELTMSSVNLGPITDAMSSASRGVSSNRLIRRATTSSTESGRIGPA